MKLVLRILNFVIIALAAVATVFLFAAPAFSFNSNVGLDIETFSQFVPESELTEDIDIVTYLGTDEIHLGIQFQLDAAGLKKTMKGDREIINNDVIGKSIDDILHELREPVKLITDYAVRGAIKKIVSQQITEQVNNARESFKEKYNQEPPLSTAEIMEEVGMDDAYFSRFARNLYNAADQDDATVTSVSNVLYAQIDEALARAEDTGMVDTSEFSEEAKTGITSSLVSSLESINLVEGEHVKKISEISYIYLSNFLKDKLNGEVSAEELNQKAEESNPDYNDRMVRTYVLHILPDGFYTGVKYVSVGLFIGLFLFTAIWVFVIVITLIKTFTKKPWTFWGPWFWLIGPLQLVLGLGLTVVGKFVLPKAPLDLLQGLPVKSVVLAPRTYALVPSIIFIVCIFLAIAYGIIKGIAKKEN